MPAEVDELNETEISKPHPSNIMTTR